MLSYDILENNLNDVVSYSEFFHALGYDDSEKVYLRRFKDKNREGDKGANHDIFLNSFDSIVRYLHEWNEKDYGIFFVVNGGGNDDASVKMARAQFIDMDDFSFEEQINRINNFPLIPSIIIKTQKSLHCYWILKDTHSLPKYRELQERLIQYFESDKSIKNESRVMRLYGFEHRKKQDPVMVKLIHFQPELTYTQEQLHEVLPALKRKTSLQKSAADALSEEYTIKQKDRLIWFEQFAEKHNILIKVRKFENNCIYLGVDCPWKDEHTEDTHDLESHIMIYDTGAIAYKCYHGHCVDRKWNEYRAFYEPVTFNDFQPFEGPPLANLPRFPVTALPKVLHDYCISVAESYQVVVDMAACEILGVIALCCQGGWKIEVKPDWVETVNLYIAEVARPSEKKSPTLREVMSPVVNYVRDKNEQLEPEISRSKIEVDILRKRLDNLKAAASKGTSGKKKNSGAFSFDDEVEEPKASASAVECFVLAEELRDKEKNIPKKTLICVDDVTPEALAEALADNDERMGIVSAEGGIFGILAGRYNKDVNLDVFLKAWSGESVSVKRRSDGNFDLENPLLTMLLLLQPSLIEKVMTNEEFRGRGLLARFFYSVPGSMVGKRRFNTIPVPHEVRQNYINLIMNLLQTRDGMDKEKNAISLSSGATKVIEDFFYLVESELDKTLQPIEDWAGKLVGNTARIAALLHICENGAGSTRTPLDEKTMQCAVEIGKYFIEHSLAAFSIMDMLETPNVRDAKYIWNRMTKDKTDITDKTTKRDLLRLCTRFKTMPDLEPGLKELNEHGYIRIESGGSATQTDGNHAGGRKRSDIIIINPVALNESSVSSVSSVNCQWNI